MSTHIYNFLTRVFPDSSIRVEKIGNGPNSNPNLRLFSLSVILPESGLPLAWPGVLLACLPASLTVFEVVLLIPCLLNLEVVRLLPVGR